MIYKIAYAAFAISFLVGIVLDKNGKGFCIKIVHGLIIFMVLVAQTCGVGE